MKSLKKVIAVFLIPLAFVSISGCNPDTENSEDVITNSIEKFGSNSTMEIATWNMHNFPDNGDKSIESYKIIIEKLDIDIYAVQEIANTSSFKKLMSQLSDYDGLYSDDTYDSGYQKTGIIYKKNMVTVLSKDQIYQDKKYEFPRPPIVLYLRVNKDSQEYDFYLIVIHLKAYEGTEELDRRRGAVKLLKEYMDERISNSQEKDYIIAGDWNDELSDDENSNSFTLLLNDINDYRFLTLEISGDPVYASYPYKGSLIDHILISAQLFDEYENGSTITLKIDSHISGYFSNVSDHRPVVSIFPIFD